MSDFETNGCYFSPLSEQDDAKDQADYNDEDHVVNLFPGSNTTNARSKQPSRTPTKLPIIATYSVLPTRSVIGAKLHWPQRNHVSILGTTENYTGNYLTKINFNDPTKSYPAMRETSLQYFPKNQLLQRLVLSTPSAFHWQTKEVDYTLSLNKLGILLNELGSLTGLDVVSMESFVEIEKTFSASSKKVSLKEGRRIADIVDDIVRFEWEFKKGLGYGFDEDSKHDDRFMMGMWRRGKLAAVSVMEWEGGLESFTEPLEPLFGQDFDDGSGVNAIKTEDAAVADKH